MLVFVARHTIDHAFHASGIWLTLVNTLASLLAGILIMTTMAHTLGQAHLRTTPQARARAKSLSSISAMWAVRPKRLLKKEEFVPWSANEIKTQDINANMMMD